jgi:hypothetical protein
MHDRLLRPAQVNRGRIIVPVAILREQRTPAVARKARDGRGAEERPGNVLEGILHRRSRVQEPCRPIHHRIPRDEFILRAREPGISRGVAPQVPALPPTRRRLEEVEGRRVQLPRRRRGHPRADTAANVRRPLRRVTREHVTADRDLRRRFKDPVLVLEKPLHPLDVTQRRVVEENMRRREHHAVHRHEPAPESLGRLNLPGENIRRLRLRDAIGDNRRRNTYRRVAHQIGDVQSC